MNFESELKKGNFVIGTCTDCDRVVWPPSNLCNSCFGKIIWKKASLVGKLIEYSKKNDIDFCLAEFENGVRIMGDLILKAKKPEIGAQVKLEKCGITDGNYSFVMSCI